MNKKVKPFIIVISFWFVLFIFVIASYSGSFGFGDVTGLAVAKDGSPTPLGVQSIAILVLFFTNLVTLFFLIREMTKS